MNKRVKPIMGEPFDVTKMQEEITELVEGVHDRAGEGTGPESFRRRAVDTLDRPSPAQGQEDNQQVVAEDPINPSHYRRHPSGVECIEIARHMTFNVGNAIKYLWRYQDKGDPVENLKKAQWYIDDEIRRLEGKR